MKLEALLTSYKFSDGEVVCFGFDYASKAFTVTVRIRKYISEKRYEPVTVNLEFSGVTELDIFEDFPTNGGCTDVTLTRLDNAEFYLSFDPYGNTGLPHEQDNWVVKAKSLTFINEDGVRKEVNG